MSELTNIRNWLTGCPQMRIYSALPQRNNDGDNS